MTEGEDHPGLGLEWLVAAVPEALLIVGPRGIIEHANLSAAHMFGYSLDELVGAKIEMLIPTRFRTEHVHARTEFTRAPYDRPMGSKLEISALRRDGSEFPVDIELRPRRSPEGPMTIAVLRELEGSLRAANESVATWPNADAVEIHRLLAPSRSHFAEAETRLAEVLAAAGSPHGEPSEADSDVAELFRIVAATRSSLLELLSLIDAGRSPDDRGD